MQAENMCNLIQRRAIIESKRVTGLKLRNGPRKPDQLSRRGLQSSKSICTRRIYRICYSLISWTVSIASNLTPYSHAAIQVARSQAWMNGLP
jgi:hypothetical protein